MVESTPLPSGASAIVKVPAGDDPATTALYPIISVPILTYPVLATPAIVPTGRPSNV